MATIQSNKDIIITARDNWDEGNITDAIMERFNCREASVDDEGDVWIADPQQGHWLNDDEMAGLIDWMRDRKMI